MNFKFFVMNRGKRAMNSDPKLGFVLGVSSERLFTFPFG